MRKISKLQQLETFGSSSETSYAYAMDVHRIATDLIDKINEIIDHLNSEEELPKWKLREIKRQKDQPDKECEHRYQPTETTLGLIVNQCVRCGQPQPSKPDKLQEGRFYYGKAPKELFSLSVGEKLTQEKIDQVSEGVNYFRDKLSQLEEWVKIPVGANLISKADLLNKIKELREE